jgi:RNA polymerase sigma-70 factor (ECF subfamily)
MLCMSGAVRQLTPGSDETPVSDCRDADMTRMMAEVTTSEQRARFEALYEAHRPAVLAYCLRRTSSSDAADACAETFLVAWRRIDDLPPPPETIPYLYGIARRVLSNQLRALHRRSRLDARLHGLGVTPPPDPLTLVVQRARDREVVAAVRRLRPRDREIVMLHTWEDLPRETIAKMLGMTRAAVDQRIHRCYQRLARSLASTADRRAMDSAPVFEEGGTR